MNAKSLFIIIVHNGKFTNDLNLEFLYIIARTYRFDNVIDNNNHKWKSNKQKR
jgi:hypothetical protein